jgi:tetratricopeptide (TPR) repeat protein
VQGDPPSASGAREFAQESAEIFKALGDDFGAGRALSALGSAYCIHGEYAEARLALEQSIVLAQAVGDRAGLAFALGQRGNVMEHDGDYDAARRFREEAVAVAREIGDRHSLGIALAALAYQARVRGDLAQATAHLHECLRLGTELGRSWRVLPRALGGLAGLACLEGDYRGSARLFGAAESLWDASGKWDMPWWRAVFDADRATVGSILGEDSFAEAFGEGRAMRLEDVLESALDSHGPASHVR